MSDVLESLRTHTVHPVCYATDGLLVSDGVDKYDGFGAAEVCGRDGALVSLHTSSVIESDLNRQMDRQTNITSSQMVVICH